MRSSTDLGVDVVVVDLDAPAMAGLPPDAPAALEAMLDDDEIAAAGRLRTATLRRRFVVSHAATRVVLGSRLGIDPAEVVLRRAPCVRCGGAHGRPYVGGADLAFSLAHCGDRAVIATTSGRPVGVDIECVRPMRDAIALAHYVADEAEMGLLEVSSDISHAFLSLWVRKEAVVKATGEGISAARRYSFSGGPPPGWWVQMLDAGEAHVSAVAVRPPT